MVEAPLAIQDHYQQDPLLADHLNTCKLSYTPSEGNAAANTQDFHDLDGANIAVGPLLRQASRSGLRRGSLQLYQWRFGCCDDCVVWRSTHWEEVRITQTDGTMHCS